MRRRAQATAGGLLEINITSFTVCSIMYLNYHCEGSGSQRSLSEGTSVLSKEFKSSSSLPGRVNKRVVIALKTRVSAEDSHSETELD